MGPLLIVIPWGFFFLRSVFFLWFLNSFLVVVSLVCNDYSFMIVIRPYALYHNGNSTVVADRGLSPYT